MFDESSVARASEMYPYCALPMFCTRYVPLSKVCGEVQLMMMFGFMPWSIAVASVNALNEEPVWRCVMAWLVC